jgi:Tol biopolymer transport system component
MGLLFAVPSPAVPLPLTPVHVVQVTAGQRGDSTGWQDVYYPAISANGRYVAFTSVSLGWARPCNPQQAQSLGSQVYLHDLQRGTTELVTARPDGCPGSSGEVGPASLSADGRYVAFVSAAHDLVPGFTPSVGLPSSVYVRDMLRHRTYLVSVSYDGHHYNNDAASIDPFTLAISGDGRYVAFASFATNLVRNDARPRGVSAPEIYIRDLRARRTERLGPRGLYATEPSISADGRYVAFGTSEQGLDGTPNYGDLPIEHYDPHDGPGQIYIYDRVTKRFQMASRSDSGLTGNEGSDLGPAGQAISADGRYVVFSSTASNLVPNDDSVPTTSLEPDLTQDIYLYDRVARHLVRVSQGPGGVPANYGSAWPSISANGRWIAFHSGATNLGPVDVTVPVTDYVPSNVESFGYDIYLHDRLTGDNTLVSTNAMGVQGDFSSWNAVVSGDGKTVAYESAADNLVPNDTNAGHHDIFAWRP